MARIAKIADNVPFVTCGNKIFRDKNRTYNDGLWGEETFKELIRRGFLVEIQESKSTPQTNKPKKK